MVKVEIERNNKREQIDVRVKAKDGKDILLKMIEVQDTADKTKEQLATIMEEYLGLLDDIARRSTGLTLDELNNLDLDEKNKISGKIVELARDSLGFSKLSIR